MKKTEDTWNEVSAAASAESWEKGTTIVGTYLGMEDSTFQRDDGSLAQIVTFDVDGDARIFWVPAILKNRLEKITIGTKTKVVCKGKTKTRSGRSAWDFAVFTAN